MIKDKRTKKYNLQDVEEPNLYREFFRYNHIPKYSFNAQHITPSLPRKIWITDTTFRDGQQSRAPYSIKQIVTLFDFLHKLSGPKGIIRQSEFFLYSTQDRRAVQSCQERGYTFPEITGWIRAIRSDFLLAKKMHLKEIGILTSCSDYHIFKKLNMTRKQAMEKYLEIINYALDAGIKPRCHFEDITRADFFGFVIPFAQQLRKLMTLSKIPIKIRICDTLGLGIFYPDADLPRSIPFLISGMKKYADIPSELLEWHGHEDFYKSVANAVTAWRYGASSVNCTLLGIGERTGNIPLEAMIIEYMQLKGTNDGIDTAIITEIAQYYEKVIGYTIPPRTPFIGKNFNVTQAGIHADGLLKNEEIYNIFNTEKLLNRPVKVSINQYSGHACVAFWINNRFGFKGKKIIDKKDERVVRIKQWIDNQYKRGRITTISDEELERLVKKYLV